MSMTQEQVREHERQIKEFLDKQKHEKSEQQKKEDNEKARLRMVRLRGERGIEEAEETGALAKPGKMCEEKGHEDIPAKFVLQTVGQLEGLPPRVYLCPWSASKIDVVPFPPSQGEGQMCINVTFHEKHPKIEAIATALLQHHGLFGNEIGPLPLCKYCSSPFALQVRPMNEEAEVKFDWMVPMTQRAKAQLIVRLLKVANHLDKRGFYKEADTLDSVCKSAGEMTKYHIKSLEQFYQNLPSDKDKRQFLEYMEDYENRNPDVEEWLLSKHSEAM